MDVMVVEAACINQGAGNWEMVVCAINELTY